MDIVAVEPEGDIAKYSRRDWRQKMLDIEKIGGGRDWRQERLETEETADSLLSSPVSDKKHFIESSNPHQTIKIAMYMNGALYRWNNYE